MPLYYQVVDDLWFMFILFDVVGMLQLLTIFNILRDIQKALKQFMGEGEQFV